MIEDLLQEIIVSIIAGIFIVCIVFFPVYLLTVIATAGANLLQLEGNAYHLFILSFVFTVLGSIIILYKYLQKIDVEKSKE